MRDAAKGKLKLVSRIYLQGEPKQTIFLLGEPKTNNLLTGRTKNKQFTNRKTKNKQFTYQREPKTNNLRTLHFTLQTLRSYDFVTS